MLLVLLIVAFADPPKITISKETTFAVAPLRADGVIDYIGAVNALYADVKPDENAGVLLAKAIGPKVTTPLLAKEYFRRLGCDPLPANGKYLLDVETFAEEIEANKDKLTDDLNVSQRGPWSKKKYPEVASLLKRNAAALEIVVAASRKPKLYAPILCAQDPPVLMFCPLGMASGLRNSVAQLISRAMLRLQDEDIDGATADLAACHRLNKLLGSGPRSAMEGVVAFLCFERAMEAERSIAASGLLSPAATAERRKRIAALKPPIEMRSTIDQFERLSILSALVYTAAYEPSKALGKNQEQASSIAEFFKLGEFDADEAARTVNEGYDRFVKAAFGSAPTKMLESFEEIASEMKRRRDHRDVFTIRSRTHPNGPKAATGRLIGEVFLEQLTPDFSSCARAVMKAQVAQRFTVLTYALRDHHRKHGRYPETLDAAPLDVPSEILIDPFIDKPFTYRLENGKRQIVCASFDGTVGFYKSGDRVTNLCDDVVLNLP